MKSIDALLGSGTQSLIVGFVTKAEKLMELELRAEIEKRQGTFLTIM